MRNPLESIGVDQALSECEEKGTVCQRYLEPRKMEGLGIKRDFFAKYSSPSERRRVEDALRIDVVQPAAEHAGYPRMNLGVPSNLITPTIAIPCRRIILIVFHYFVIFVRV